MRPTDAEGALAELQAVRHAARRRMEAFWVPVTGIGVGMIVVGLLSLRWPTAFAPGIVAVCVLGSIGATLFFRRRGTRLGLRKVGWPYLAVSGVILFGCFALAAVVPVRPPDSGSWLVVALGYLGFAWFERSTALIATGGAFATVAVGTMAVFPRLPLGVTTAAEGIVAVAAGLLMRAGPAA